MRDFPNEFGDVFISLIQAGEKSGELVNVLENMTENLKWEDEQAVHTQNLFIYPLFVLIILIPVLFLLMLYLVPQLVDLLEKYGSRTTITNTHVDCNLRFFL